MRFSSEIEGFGGVLAGNVLFGWISIRCVQIALRFRKQRALHRPSNTQVIEWDGLGFWPVQFRPRGQQGCPISVLN